VKRGRVQRAAEGRGALTHGLPSGAAAYVFEEAARRRRAEDRIVEALRAAGYREAIVPSADYLAPYLSHVSPREERELYRFVDRHGDTLALRADFTIALARHLAPRLAADASVERVFYRGEVLRGGARDGGSAEFYQIGAERLGPGAEGDLEIVAQCLAALEAAGSKECYVVLSCVRALEEILQSESTSGVQELAEALRERRLAETDRLARAVSSGFAGLVRRLLEGDLPPKDPLLSRLGEAGESLARIADALSKRKGCRVAIDLAEPAPRSYYTGFFFSIYGQSAGEPIAGGGRYDDLYGAFGSPRPAVGFALGLEGVVGDRR
jgi:ATP phosphoribosyltransferase regulatory subunit